MKPTYPKHRSRVFVRVAIALLCIQLLTEIADSRYLQRFGLQGGEFEIHLIKFILITVVTVPVAVLWLYRDYTYRTEAEIHIRESQQNLRSLFDHNPDMIALYNMDGEYVDANPAFLCFAGVSIERMKELRAFLVLDEAYSAELKDYFERARNGSPHKFATKQIRRTGEEVYLDITYFPMYRNDVPAGVYAIIQDVTATKITERELHEAQAFLSSFVAHTTDAISIVDATGRVLLLNPAWEELYGWSAAEIIGKPIPTPDIDLIRSVVSQRTAISLDMTVSSRRGRSIPVAISAAPILSTDGEMIGVSFITKDMTMQKETEAHMLRSEKLSISGELAAGVAHEIRNPIAAIHGFLQLMKTSPERKYLDIVLEEVDRVSQITNELLLLAKPQAEVFEETNVEVIIRDVLVLMKSQANMNSIVMTEDISPNLPLVSGITNQLKQVFINIVKNAIEVQPNGGQLLVSAHVINGQVTVKVMDNGPGLSFDAISKLGQPFYTTKERGTGLGLMVTYRIIQNHQGKVTVESAIGKGTCFTITLPCSESKRIDQSIVDVDNLASAGHADAFVGI